VNSFAAIRPAQSSDAEDLIQVHYDAVQAISHEFYSQELLDAWSPPPSVSRYEWMRTIIVSDNRTVFVAEIQNEVCGFSICLLRESLIYALYISPNSVRRGLGKVLLNHTENHLAHVGVSRAKLNASINAVQFYKTMGYSIIRPSTQALADGSEMDCFEMKKDLQSPNS